MKNLVILIMFVISVVTHAQPPSGQVTDFSGINVAKDAPLSLSQYQKEEGVVVIFRSNECPFDGYYTQRISELVKQYGNKIPFLLVNPHLEAPEAIDKMKMYSTVWGLGIPYIADKEQSIMTALGARKTPEAFVLKKTGETFSIIYAGAIDDNPQLPAGVKQKHLQTAIEALLNSQSQLTAVRATGCTIRKK